MNFCLSRNQIFSTSNHLLQDLPLYSIIKLPLQDILPSSIINLSIQDPPLILIIFKKISDLFTKINVPLFAVHTYFMVPKHEAVEIGVNGQIKIISPSCPIQDLLLTFLPVLLVQTELLNMLNLNRKTKQAGRYFCGIRSATLQYRR